MAAGETKECRNLTYDPKYKGGWFCTKYKTTPPHLMKCQNAMLLCHEQKGIAAAVEKDR